MRTIVQRIRAAVAGAGALILISAPGAAAQTAETVDLFRIGNALESVRRTALRDTSKVDFCAVSELWDGGGRLRLMNGSTISAQQNRSECRPPFGSGSAAGGPVVIHSIQFHTDSIVLRGSTTRDKRTVLLESYLYRRDPTKGVFEYRMEIIQVVE
jgi:hypothetical protein